VLAAGGGMFNQTIANELSVTANTVRKRRSKYYLFGIGGSSIGDVEDAQLSTMPGCGINSAAYCEGVAGLQVPLDARVGSATQDTAQHSARYAPYGARKAPREALAETQLVVPVRLI